MCTTLVARALPDQDSWLVRKRIAKDIYTPKNLLFTQIISEPRQVFEEMNAGEAREKGFKVDPKVPDMKVVRVEWLEDVERTVTWSETRLVFRGKVQRRVIIPRRTSKPVTIKLELAAAREAPLSFVGYDKLIDLIQEEINFGKNHNLDTQPIKPVALVLLGVRSGKTQEAYSREVFFIKSYTDDKMSVVDSADRAYEIELTPDVLAQSTLTSCILFFPNNIKLYSTDDKIIF